MKLSTEFNIVFLDTSMFKALVDEKDDFHKQAIQIWQRLKQEKTQLVTSNYMLDETFTLLRKRRGRIVVDEFRKSFLKTNEIKIIRITVADEAGAWKWFLLDWSDLSFTDCVSFALMKRLNLIRVATFDQDFQRAGFKIEG